MIEHYLRPTSTQEALALMEKHAADATWFAGGSKLNAKPTQTDKTVAISLAGLSLTTIEQKGDALHIGAMSTVQTLIDNELTPTAIKFAGRFIYSRHVRNQATIAGEIASLQDESLLLPCLIALNAEVVLSDGQKVLVEDYVEQENKTLILQVIIPDTSLACITENVRRSAGGLSVISAAVSVAKNGETIIALEGVASGKRRGAPVRLRDVEHLGLTGEALEKAVADAIIPQADLRGSVEYKRYIAGVLVTDLLAECQRLAGRA